MGGFNLGDLWFVIAAIFWVGFFVLEGFDFGVGMLHSFIGRNDLERRVLVNTIGPVWDGNEVWLIVAGAILFSAFPGWYATMFSSLYLAMVILLAALMARGVSFEYQRKFDDPRWRSAWRWALTDRQRPHSVPPRGGPGRPAPRPAHQQFARVHRQLLRPARRRSACGRD